MMERTESTFQTFALKNAGSKQYDEASEMTPNSYNRTKIGPLRCV